MSTHTTVRYQSTTPLGLPPRRPWDGVLARLLAPWLDDRLARGRAPESTALLAARAAQLMDPRARRSLADSWDQLLDRASQPRTVIDPRVPVARAAVRAATTEIAALSTALRSSRPLAVGDVARAQDLLTDGLGPVYRPGLGLRTALTRLLDGLDATALS